MLGFLNGIGRNSGVSELVSDILFTFPAEFLSRWTPAFNIYEKENGSFTTDFDITSVKPVGLIAYVAKDGNDATGDGTEGAPYRTIQKAYDEGGVDIRIKSGFYNNADGFTNIAPTRDVSLTAVDGAGSVIVAKSYDGLSWAQQAGANNDVYLSTASQCMFVLDRTNGRVGEFLLDGVEEVPIPLIEVGSVTACQSTPGSYYHIGSDLYVHTHDSRAPDNDVVVLNEDRLMWFVYGTDQKFYYEGLELWGRGGVRTQHSSVNTNMMGAKDCGFRFSDWSIDLVSVQGTRYNYFINCHVSDHTSQDGFGYVSTNAAAKANALEVNCSARRCGNAGAVNDNAFTAHNESNVIRLNVYGMDCYGPIIADTTGSYSVNLNCTSANSLVSGTNQARVGYQIGSVSNFDGTTTSKMWLKNCTAIGEYYDRGQATGGELFDLGGFSGESTGGDYGTIN